MACQGCRRSDRPHRPARLRILSRYLHALTQAGLLDADPLAEFRLAMGTGAGNTSSPPSSRPIPRRLSPRCAVTPLPPGPLATHVRSYVELHRALGKQFDFNAHILEDFDDFLRADSVLAVGEVTQDHVGRWLDAMTCTPRRAESKHVPSGGSSRICTTVALFR